jgi:hypothetical protein
VTLAQRLLEGRVKIGGARVLAVVEVLRQQRFVLLDQLVDQLAVGMGDRIEVGVALVVFQHLDHILAAMRRQIEQQAFLAEALADLVHQRRQVDVVGIDLVDHDHARQAARLGGAHHALGGKLDAGLGVDDDDRGFDTGQGGHRLPGKVGVARGVDQVDMHALGGKVHQRRIERVAGRLFLRVEVADAAALFHAALGGDGAGLEQQGFGQGGLAGAAMADQGQGADGFSAVIRHDADSLCWMLCCSKFYPSRRGWSREGMRHSQIAVATPIAASSACSQGLPEKLQNDTQIVRLISVIASHLTR